MSGTGRDYLTREQVRDRLDCSLYLEAGAGTGKTDALVARLSQLLMTGKAKPEEIAAITFTRSAALEMRSRLRASLEKRVAEETDPANKQRLEEVVGGLDSLAIQTIHAFALSMLRERPLDVGLPPVLESLDDVQERVEFDESWSQWIGERLETSDSLITALRMVQRFGISPTIDRLKQLAQALVEKHQDLSPGMFTYIGPAPTSVSVSRVVKAYENVQSILDKGPDADDSMCKFCNDIVMPELDSLLSIAGDTPEFVAGDFIGVPPIFANRKGNTRKWRTSHAGEEGLHHLREMLESLELEFAAARELLKRQITATLASAAADFALEYVGGRRRGGRLTFDDQMVLARDLLKSSEEARSRFRKRHQFILVDEFQDTDPVQIDLIRLLAGTGEVNCGPLRDGSLFIVGDPKQSIYRFRGADPISAASFSDEVGKSGLKLLLSENHRSVPGVLDWINAVFSKWMNEGAPQGQAPYRDLIHDGNSGDCDLPVQWFGFASDHKAGAVRELEFQQIAEIAAVAGAGGLRVRGKDGELRASVFADVVVLVKSRTGIEFLEDALVQQRVPYVFDGQAPLFTSQDVRDLHVCLSAIDDPSDQVAVLGALRSPAFSCPDTDLLRWKRRGGSFNYQHPSCPNEPESVARAFDSLRNFHRMSRDIDTAKLVENFVRERRLREKALLSRLGPERIRRIDLVVELASVLPDAGVTTLREFTRWLEQQSIENARMPEHISQGASTGAIRVMTVHGSKGLEFPIVILASASSGSPNHDSVQVRSLIDADGNRRIGVQLGEKNKSIRTISGGACSGWEDAEEYENEQSQLENVRLLYVAATRARDHLLISRHRSAKGKNDKSLVAEMERHLEGHEHLWREWSPPAVIPRPIEQPVSASPSDTKDDFDLWVKQRVQLIDTASRPGYITPSALKAASEQRVALLKEPSENLDDEPGRTGRGASERGRAVHAVLQHIELTHWTDADIIVLSRRMAEEHGVEREALEVAELACAVLRTETMIRASAAAKRGEAWREVPVAAHLQEVGAELEGQIDLLFKEEDGSLCVVDYKTDRVEGRDLADAAGPYRHQLGGYAWCIEQVTGMEVSRAVLIFARGEAAGVTGDYELQPLAHLKREAAELAVETLKTIPILQV